MLVELQWEDAVRGARRLLTECVAEAASVPAGAGTNLVRIPLEVGTGKAAALTPTPRDPKRPTGARRSEAPTMSEYPPDSEQWQQYKESQQRYHLPERQQQVPQERSSSRPPKTSKDVLTRSSNKTQILVAIIATIPLILAGYWQFVYHPAELVVNKVPVIYTGQVLNAQTKESVPDARITVDLDSGTGLVETYTDSRGSFAFDLGLLKKGTRGKVYVRAENFVVLEKNFVIGDSLAHDEFRLEPAQNSPPPPKGPR